MTSTLHTQNALSLALSSPAIHGTTEEGQGRSQSTVAEQLIPCRHRLFQSKMFLVIGCVLAVMILQGLPCLAQADIDPDHYEITNSNPISQPGQSAIGTRNSEHFRGNFSLPFNVRCAGIILPPGSYSISIRSMEKRSVVRLIPLGNTVPSQSIRLTVKSLSSTGGLNALLLEHEGKERTLAGISLKDQGITLCLHAEQKRIVSAHAELVPIAYTTPVTGEN